jgi:NTE family protein
LTLFSQEQNKPKVGLVLSGGAKGFAHIGVLKVLEEAGLKIDYIGGTVWGLLLGCMHQDIPQLKLIIFQSTNFDELMTSFQGLQKLL